MLRISEFLDKSVLDCIDLKGEYGNPIFMGAIVNDHLIKDGFTDEVRKSIIDEAFSYDYNHVKETLALVCLYPDEDYLSWTRKWMVYLLSCISTEKSAEIDKDHLSITFNHEGKKYVIIHHTNDEYATLQINDGEIKKVNKVVLNQDIIHVYLQMDECPF